MGSLVEHQLIVRDRADSSDLLEATSVRGGTNPYITAAPTGDGSSFDPLTGKSICASYTVRVADAITSGTSRVVTSQLEDVNQQLQLGYLKAFLKRRTDGGSWTVVCGGYLTLIRLTSGIEWEFHIQHATSLFDGIELFNATSTTTISDFLSTWPNRLAFFGGFRGSFLNIPAAFTHWQCKVHTITTLGQTRYRLEPLAFFGPGAWHGRPKTHAEVQSIAAALNETVRTLPIGQFKLTVGGATIAFSTIADAYSNVQWWPGLVLLINDVAFRPIPPGVAGLRYGQGGDPFGDIFAPLVPGSLPGVFALLDGQSALTDQSTVRVQCLTILPSELSPICVDKHPVDWLTDALTVADLDYDSSTATTLKNNNDAGLGSGLRYAELITGPMRMGELVTERVCKPFQIGLRADDQGRIVPFTTRIALNTVPAKTITDAMVVQDSVRAFEQDVHAALQRVTFKHVELTPLTSSRPDSFVRGERIITLLNPDSTVLPSGTLDIDLPGMVRSDPSNTAPVDHNWLEGLARQLFDRSGRGSRSLELDLVRGDATVDSLVLGEEVFVNIKQLPNHNKRLGDDSSVGARAMQITRITEEVSHRSMRFEDAGPNANALGTKPTHTIAASAELPRTVAEVTITNAAALNALGYAVRLQMAVGAAPATTDFVDFYSSKQGSIPTGVITVPRVAAGSEVSIRAKSEKTGSRPSDWSTAVNVTLTAVAAVTGLAAATVAGDGSLMDLTWSLGAGTTDCVLDIYVRASGAAFSTAFLVRTLDPGSTRFRVERLAVNTAYTFSVRARDPVTQDVSSLAEDTETTANSTRALSAPTQAVGFSGTSGRRPVLQGFSDAPARNGDYGIAVMASEIPGFIEVQQAVEDSVGAGTYGAYATVAAAVEAIAGGFTTWTGRAPNDGLRRKLKARSVLDGCTPSAYSSEVVVTPWTFSPIPNAESIEDSDGDETIIDTVNKNTPSGLGLGLGIRTSAAHLIGTTVGFPAARHTEQHSAADTDSVSFSVSYEAIPQVKVLPQCWQLPGTSSTSDRKIEFKAINTVVSGCDVRAKMSTGATSTSRSDDFAASLNGAPQAGGISLSTTGSAAYANLSNANGVSTTYDVYYDVDSTSMGVGKLLYVKIYKNDGTGSTNWTEVASAQYDAGVNVTGEVLSFVATLSANFDVRLVITYSGTQPPGNATVVADRVEYEEITAGTEAGLTDNSDAALLVQAIEAS